MSGYLNFWGGNLITLSLEYQFPALGVSHVGFLD